MNQITQHRTPTLNAGRLRHRIDIVTQTGVQDSTGGWSLADTQVFASVWATVEALSGDEQFVAGTQVSKVSHRVVLRYLAGVTSAMQVRWQGRKFQITDVLNPDGRTKMLALDAVEIGDSVNQ